VYLQLEVLKYKTMDGDNRIKSNGMSLCIRIIPQTSPESCLTLTRHLTRNKKMKIYVKLVSSTQVRILVNESLFNTKAERFSKKPANVKWFCYSRHYHTCVGFALQAG
jgi:hypothetical protein